MGNQEEVTVYDEVIARMARRLGLTVSEVDAIMTMYAEESKQVHVDRGHLARMNDLQVVASPKRTVVE